MSEDWAEDMYVMHERYGVHQAVAKKLNDPKWMREFLKFRINFLKEELKETSDAFDEKDPEEIVDGLIDLCVIAIGTLDLFGVDAHKAWEEVLSANMTKEVGMKASRPNKLGLPDLIKPEGWKGPSHAGNHGDLTVACSV